MEKGVDSIGDIDMRWRLLSGKITSRETRFLLAEAVAIFHVCAEPFNFDDLTDYYDSA